MAISSNELLAHLVGVQTAETPAPIDLLESLRETPQGPSELAQTHPISRKSVYSALDPLVEQYVLVQDGSGYELTGYGMVLCAAFTRASETEELDRSAIRFLLASTNRVALLEELQASPARKATLADGASAPSRTTVHRAIEAFTEKGWVTQISTGEWQLTDAGENTLRAFVSLLDDIGTTQAAAPFLYCCGEAVAEIPIEGLANADVHVDRPQAPDTSRGLLRELTAPDLETFHGLISTVSTAAADIGDPIIESGAETELIIPEPVLFDLPTKGHYADHVKQGLEARNFKLLVVPDTESLPVALGIFDDETILMSPASFDHVPTGGNAGTIVSSDEALVAWAKDLYICYHDRARTPTSHVIHRLKEKIADSLSSMTPRGSEDD